MSESAEGYSGHVSVVLDPRGLGVYVPSSLTPDRTPSRHPLPDRTLWILDSRRLGGVWE